MDKNTLRAIERYNYASMILLHLKVFARVSTYIMQKNIALNDVTEEILESVVDRVRKETIDWFVKLDIDILKPFLNEALVLLGKADFIMLLRELDKFIDKHFLSAVLELDINTPFIIKLSELFEELLNRLQKESDNLIKDSLSDDKKIILSAISGNIARGKEWFFKNIYEEIKSGTEIINSMREKRIKTLMEELPKDTNSIKELRKKILDHVAQMPDVNERKRLHEYYKKLPDNMLIISIKKEIIEKVDSEFQQMTYNLIGKFFKKFINNILITLFNKGKSYYKKLGFNEIKLEDTVEKLDKKIKPKDIIDLLKGYFKTGSYNSTRQTYYNSRKIVNNLIKEIGIESDIDKSINQLINKVIHIPSKLNKTLYDDLKKAFNKTMEDFNNNALD